LHPEPYDDLTLDSDDSDRDAEGDDAEGEENSVGDSEDSMPPEAPEYKPAGVNSFSGTLMIVNDAYIAHND
jgi:hypothetical protein